MIMGQHGARLPAKFLALGYHRRVVTSRRLRAWLPGWFRTSRQLPRAHSSRVSSAITAGHTIVWITPRNALRGVIHTITGDVQQRRMMRARAAELHGVDL